MKTNRSFKFLAALLMLGTVCAFANVAQAATAPVSKAAPKAKAPKVTTETSYIGSAEQVVVTEKYKDGTVIRVVQVIHQDGTSETCGERHVNAVKS